MSDKFILFNDEKIDPSLLMTLTDLAELLCEDEHVKVNFKKFSYYDPVENIVNVSFKWKHRSNVDVKKLLKADCIIGALGFQYLNLSTIDELYESKETYQHPKFFIQLFQLIEEFRVKNLILKARPITKKFIDVRTEVKISDNASQIKFYLTKTVPTDLTFLYIEQAILNDNFLSLQTPFESHLDSLLQQHLPKIYDLKNSDDSLNLAILLMDIIDSYLKQDMLNEYYYIPKIIYDEYKVVKKNNETKNQLDVADMEQSEQVKSKQSQAKTNSTYLETEVQDGQNSNQARENDRQGEASDDITELTLSKGKAQKNQLDALGNDISDYVGEENQYTEIIWKKTNATNDQQQAYQTLKNEVNTEIKQLINVINKSVEHQENSRRNQLAKGKLSRQLVKYFTDDSKRIFYKDDQKSYQLDATFMLLVDASYSMEDKIEETKKGMILFHETLKQLHIYHEMIAFSEDGFGADDFHQPNIFEHIIPYENSLNANISKNIAAYQNGEDNRDGLAIRVAGEMLKLRPQKQKFLIIFSDGEPSAHNYEQNGIIDTHDAVVLLRKANIFVINIFISQNKIDESTKLTIKNIYNDYCIFVEGAQLLPSIIKPLLQKLLLQTMKQH